MLRLLDATDTFDSGSTSTLVDIASRLNPGGLSGLLFSSTIRRWTSAAGVAYASVARVFTGRHIVADIVIRSGGRRSPDTCEGAALVSTVLRGVVECKELMVANQPAGRADRGYVCQSQGSSPVHSADRLTVSSKFVLEPSRGLLLASTGILTMKAIKDSLELRVTKVSTTGSQPWYFWKAEGAVDPGVPRVEELSPGKLAAVTSLHASLLVVFSVPVCFVLAVQMTLRMW